MNIIQYNIPWLTDTGSYIDFSNNIVYTNVNKQRATYFNSFIDVSGGDIVLRGSGKIYNNHLSNYLSYHDQYIVSLSGAINSINPYIYDTYNFTTISGMTISSYIPSVINRRLNYHNLYLVSLSGLLLNQININLYQASQINTISSYINNIKIPNNDNYLISLSGSISSINTNLNNLSSNAALLNNNNNFTGSNNFYDNNVNIFGGYYLGFRDSLDLYGTYFGQNAANFEINNYGDSIILTAPTFDLNNTYTILKGGTNINNYTTALPYTDGKNYITGETNLRLGDVNINDGLLTAYNGLTVYGSLSLPNNSIDDAALSANIATISYVDNYFITLSSNIYNFKPLNYDLQLNTISSYIVTNNNKLSYHDLYLTSLSSSVLSQYYINGYQISQINTISSYIVTNDNKLSYYNLYLYSLSASIKAQSTGSILDSQLSSDVCLLNSTQTLTNKTLTTPIIVSIKPTSSLTLTLPSLTDTLVSRNSTDTLTNKTINAGTFTGVSNFNENISINTGKVLTFKDNYTTVSQTNITQYNGSLSIQNFANPNVSGGYIIFYVKDTTNTLLDVTILHYGGYYQKYGIPIYLYNASNTNYLKIEQYLFNSYLSNYAFDSAITPYMIFRTRNSAGNLIENMKLSPTLTQITTSLTCSNGFTLSSGALSLPNNSISDNALSSNVCLLNGTQTLINKTLSDCIANTQLLTDNSTKISTTAFVKGQNYLTSASLSGYLRSNSSISDTQLSSNIPRLNGNNIYTGSNSTFSGGPVEITNGTLLMRNGNGISFYDTEPTPNQCAVYLAQGNLGFDNYTDPLDTSGGGNIQFNTYNLTTPFPRFHTRLNINYNGIQVKKGHLKIYNYDETSYLQADQTTTISTIKNTAISGPLLLQTTNASSALITNINMTPTNTTIGNNLVCNANITLPSTFTTQINGQLGYFKQGAVISLTYTSLVNAQVYGIAVISLPIGVWHVFGQACYSFASTATLLYEQISINQDTQNTIIDTNNFIMNTNVSSNSGYSSVKRIDAVIQSPNTNTLCSLTISVGISSGTPVFISNTSQQYVRIYAVRIA